MSGYPLPEYSHNDIERAGRVISGDLKIVDGMVPQHIRDAFLIANNWRDAHAFPMRSVHLSVAHHLRASGLEGVTSARLKRMQAIRRKLRRIRLGLDQIQDLGGCRVILDSIADVNTLIGVLNEKLLSDVQKEDNYIAEPKKDGYRSHHLRLGFKHHSGPTPYDDKRIELQIRTRLQHSWATTVEAIGLMRGEELKNHQGNQDWLRLFVLMSAEFAEIEKCAPVPGTPEAPKRRQEIRHLAASLGAVTVLDSVSKGFKGTDIPLAPGFKPTHYLIRYDFETKSVSVEPYDGPLSATESYDKAEAILREGEEKDVVVLVEVDKVKNLRTAYPNYFGDVELFKSQLREITFGRSAVEYSVAKKQKVFHRPPEQPISPSWLRGSRFPKPSLKKKRQR